MTTSGSTVFGNLARSISERSGDFIFIVATGPDLVSLEIVSKPRYHIARGSAVYSVSVAWLKRRQVTTTGRTHGRICL